MEKTVDTLVPGECLLVAVKAVNGNKFQMEFAEMITNPNAITSDPLTSIFNAGDPRFSSRARRAWKSGEKTAIEGLLGITLGAMEVGSTKEINMINPKIGEKYLRIRIVETTTPDLLSSGEYQKDHVAETAKRAGSEGPFLYHNGQHIWSNTVVVTTDGEDAEHIFIEADAPVEEVQVAPAVQQASAPVSAPAVAQAPAQTSGLPA